MRRPYLGEILERATQDQYNDLFQCDRIGWIQKQPVQWEKMLPGLRMQYLERHHQYMNSTHGPSSTHKEQKNIDHMLTFIRSVNAKNCANKKLFSPDDLVLHGDVSYGVNQQFENEARMALRLANFLSAFLQIVNSDEVFSGNRLADRPLTEDQLMAETLALVLGNARIWGAGTFWERRKFPNRTLFAPYAYKEDLNTRKFKMEDLARLNSTDELYLNKPWYQHLKSRWSTNFDDLERYYVKMNIRSEEYADHTQKYEHYPTSYKAADLRHGYWTQPYFDCTGFVKKWVSTYATPFFGWDSLRAKLEFKGVVTVTMDLQTLDVNQCPSQYHTPNAFKDTNKCDTKTSYCVPILGRGFDTGGYKCECKQGFEYPFEDPITYFDGQLVESEFLNLVANQATRYDMYKCRLAGASSTTSTWTLIFSLVAASLAIVSWIAN